MVKGALFTAGGLAMLWAIKKIAPKVIDNLTQPTPPKTEEAQSTN